MDVLSAVGDEALSLRARLRVVGSHGTAVMFYAVAFKMGAASVLPNVRGFNG